VSLANEVCLTALAVTDHDTVDGLAEAIAAASEAEIELIPGIELAVTYPSGRFHMLGHFIDHNSAALNDRLTLLKENRAKRNERMVARLNAIGIPVTMDQVIAESGGGQVGRPHMAHALLKGGFVSNLKEAFEKYLADGAAAHVPKDKIELEEGISLIHSAGGLATLAHPSSIKLEDDHLRSELRRFRALGLDGVECYYSQHTPARRADLEAMARDAGLLITGGSDFHGSAKPHVFLGQVENGGPASLQLLLEMKAACRKRLT
jgi:predicted metal-dependent phosphoesterase TrpH